MGGHSGLDTMLALMDEAFRGGGIEASNESQALLTNLATVTDDQWRALPASAARSIEAIALHVGACKLRYERTRWILAAMVTHDAYHAREINQLRSTLAGDDRWRFQQLGYG